MNGKIVTVFGGTGFIGRYVIKELANAGFVVKVVGRSYERMKPLKTSGFVGQIISVIGDISNHSKIPELIDGSYAVVNLTGILYEQSSQKFQAIHSNNPEKLAIAAKKLGVKRFVHISALVDEASESNYAQSKIAGEKAVQAQFPDAVILKPSIVFGAEDNFINKFKKIAAISPILPLIGGGRTKFQPVYVGDVAKAVLFAVKEAKSGVYQLTGPETLSFKDILKRINQKRFLLNIPFAVAKFIALFLPSFILTPDQVELLKSDNIANPKGKNLKEMGINPTIMKISE